jgi:two-component system cell cycle response regulator
MMPMARLLLVEDNEVNLELMRYLLTAFGHDVVTADNGETALAALDRERVDLVICDVHMPKMDGLQFLAELKARPEIAGLPVIAVTASAMVGDREELLTAGFHGYLSKPIDPRRFVGEVEAFLPQAGSSGGPDGK